MELLEFLHAVGPRAYVPFGVTKLAEPSVVLINPSFPEDQDTLLDRYGWIIPTETELSRCVAGQTKSMLGERYGGSGITTHGGGVRCGLEGDVQIKGIGANPLAGKDVPLDYKHGGCAVFEGIQEALWGEVFHIALPYGAVRVRAVLGTGTDCWWVIKRWGREALKARYGPQVRLPRGLMLREAAIRPAHFERALLHRTASEAIGEGPNETERIHLALQFLPQLLPAPSTSSQPNSVDEKVGTGLSEMVRRFAEQTAAARSKRLMHGSISASNLTLDGRWIDFGTANTFPFWGEVNNYDSFWNDSMSYLRILRPLCINIKKHVDGISSKTVHVQHYFDLYRSVYNRVFQARFIALTGVPLHTADALAQSIEAVSLYKILLRIAKAGQTAPFDPVGLELPDDEMRHNRYQLGDCMFALASCKNRAKQTTAVMAELGDQNLCQSLIHYYNQLVALALQLAIAEGVGEAAFRRYMVHNAAKSARTIRLLYRAHMVARTEHLVLHNRGLDLRDAAQRLLQDTLNQASAIYQDASDFRTIVWRQQDDMIVFDAKTDQYAVMDSKCRRSRVVASKLHGLNDQWTQSAKQFWGDRVWGIFNEV